MPAVRVPTALLLAAALLLLTTAALAEVRQGATGEIRVNQLDAPAAGASHHLGETVIFGRIFKPSVFLVLARAEVSWSGVAVRQDYASRVVNDALRRPF
jgi:hypothetical protein